MTTQTTQFMPPSIARFSELTPTKKNYAGESVGVPVAAYEMLAAKDIYLLMAPAGTKRGMSSNKPAIGGLPGLEVSIVDCPPGNGAGLHAHHRTTETFVPLDGRYEFTWGPRGEHKVVLGPHDMISVPPGNYRSFKNVDNKPARMLVFIQGEKDAAMNDIVYDKVSAEQIEASHGGQVRDNFKHIGITFADE